MRKSKGIRGLWTFGVAAAALATVWGSGAIAQERREATTEVSGSVLIFPKVIWNGTRDTIIEIANRSNPLAFVHCFYVNAAPLNPTLPPSVTNPPQWVETDFDLVLTRQQPTHWAVSAGRRTVGTDAFASYGAGYDPGLVPPMPLNFQGELKCYQVDGEGGAPFTGNALIGTATLRRNDGDVSSYNAIALPANSDLPGVFIGNDLDLNLTDNNPGGEFAACPDTLIFNHFAYGAPDPALQALGVCTSANCSVTTQLTLVPCGQDLENQIPEQITVGFIVYDEFESRLSASTTVTCWLNLTLNALAPAGPSNPFTPQAFGGSTVRHTRIRPVPGEGGVLGVAEEFRTGNGLLPGAQAAAAYNLFTQGNRFDRPTQFDNDAPAPVGHLDQIIVPGE